MSVCELNMSSKPAITSIFDKAALLLNPVLIQTYLQKRNNSDVHKSHYFHHRFENIYLNETHIPQLEQLASIAVKHAAEILSLHHVQLQTSYWFNEMHRGDVTTMHTHDDDDELLSAVYYLAIPAGSADFLYELNHSKHTLKAEEGLFVFFSPQLPHAVEEHRVEPMRLSIAFNFGRRV